MNLRRDIVDGRAKTQSDGIKMPPPAGDGENE
jgi:hypothetical protein